MADNAPSEASVALRERLHELTGTVTRWQYPDVVRRSWDESPEPDAVRRSAFARLTACRENMNEGIELAHLALDADDETLAASLIERLAARWERWLRQVQEQQAEAAENEQAWYDEWEETLREWTRETRDALRRGAESLESGAKMALVVVVGLGALYLARR